MTHQPPYSCPRCRYSTILRGNIRQHLVTKKKTCPATVSNIELTDEIKEHIINKPIYRMTASQQTNTNTDIKKKAIDYYKAHRVFKNS